MDRKFIKELENPPKSYRPVPFWSWNERLNSDETRRQIHEMDSVGIGGYFMHARGGLQTDFMGEDWMDNVAVGIDEARKRGMEAWAYDENGWPSGFGNGMVNGLGEDYQQKYLRYKEGKIDAGPRQITQQQMSDSRELTFYYDVNPFYVDTLDPKVIKVFLEKVYQPYVDRFGDEFGKAMPGFFTDEPQVSRAGIPWSLTLPSKYLEAYQEDLLPLLPELFFDTGDYKRTRYRFWKLVQELFVTAFTQQIYEWLEERGGRLTGHMVLEETLHSQITSNGAVMPHYEFFHLPGMDWLCRHINPSTTPLQVASVAHQLGKPDIISETFALTGWNVSFEELKWIFEWQMVRGITRLCQHLEGYSLRGIRKRDYPPSLFYQQPWWAEDYKFFNDAMTRIGMLLSKGKPNFKVLVIHPQSSAWLHYDEGANSGLDSLTKDFMNLTQTLESEHIPFHYGDERIMKRHGKVRGKSIVVGTQTYDAVVVPSIDTLDDTTASLLEAFAEAGGTLLWAGSKPEFVEGKPSEKAKYLCSLGQSVPMQNLRTYLPDGARTISVTDSNGTEIKSIAVTSRQFNDSHCFSGSFYFMANAHDSADYDAVITLPGKDARLLDILTGELLPIAFDERDGNITLPHHFPLRGSIALFVSDSLDELPKSDSNRGSATQPVSASLPLDLKGKWELELVDPNSITLDYCDIWFDGQLIAEQEHISVVQSRALKLERPVDIALRFEIAVAPDFIPPGPLFLVMEQPDQYTVELNGHDVPVRDCGMYRDKSFRKIDITGKLHSGTNELWLRLNFRQSPEVYEDLRKATVFESEKNKLTFDTEIEAIYLVGDFGVAVGGGFEELPRGATRCKRAFTMVSLPGTVELGDLTYQGLPFFNGTVRLKKSLCLAEGEIEDRTIELSSVMAQVVKLHVNNTHVKSWYWRPYTANLTAMLRPGENIVQFTLTSGLRNLLGPHHMKEGESYVVHPGCFFKEPNIWGHTSWHDGYCFVKFGIEGQKRRHNGSEFHCRVNINR